MHNFIVKNKKTMRSRGGLTVSASVGKAAVLNGVIRNYGEQNFLPIISYPHYFLSFILPKAKWQK